MRQTFEIADVFEYKTRGGERTEITRTDDDDDGAYGSPTQDVQRVQPVNNNLTYIIMWYIVFVS